MPGVLHRPLGDGEVHVPVKWKIMTPEEQARADYVPPEIQAQMDRRDDFDKKHARCGECGQFLKKNTDPFGPEWESHFYKSSYEYNEWDHI